MMKPEIIEGRKRKPLPTVYINDALSQNILYYSYEKPCTIEELAKLCGVPAYYIEDRISHLLKYEAMALGFYKAGKSEAELFYLFERTEVN